MQREIQSNSMLALSDQFSFLTSHSSGCSPSTDHAPGAAGALQSERDDNIFIRYRLFGDFTEPCAKTPTLVPSLPSRAVVPVMNIILRRHDNHASAASASAWEPGDWSLQQVEQDLILIIRIRPSSLIDLVSEYESTAPTHQPPDEPPEQVFKIII